MQRVLEPEVMDGAAQAQAYARADFAAVNQGFVDALLAAFPQVARARVIDLGCGPADIPLRLARAAPAATVVGIDAAWAMLEHARARRADAGSARVGLVCARLPALPFPAGAFGAVISNSILHHLPDPAVFWAEVRRLGGPGAAVHVMDLFRPVSPEQARAIVSAAAADEDPILQEDFFNSLLAAFTPAEVQAQLEGAGLGHLACRVTSERHWAVSGHLP